MAFRNNYHSEIWPKNRQTPFLNIIIVHECLFEISISHHLYHHFTNFNSHLFYFCLAQRLALFGSNIYYVLPCCFPIAPVRNTSLSICCHFYSYVFITEHGKRQEGRLLAPQTTFRVNFFVPSPLSSSPSNAWNIWSRKSENSQEQGEMWQRDLMEREINEFDMHLSYMSGSMFCSIHAMDP